MIERYIVTLEDAARFRDVRVDMQTPNYSCRACETSYGPVTPDGPGWQMMHHAVGWARYCPSCDDARDYAFLARVDLERLRDWMQRNDDKHGGAPYVIDVEDLKRSVL